MRICVLGGGGFIGGHLVRRLVDDGHEVWVVDIVDYEASTVCDVPRRIGEGAIPTEGAIVYGGWGELYDCTYADGNSFDRIYHLAAAMGGIGFVSGNAALLQTNLRISLAALDLARDSGARICFSSSACVYPEMLQTVEGDVKLREDDAYPAAPDTEYGWEKLITERLLTNASDVETRIARFHNCFGIRGQWDGGREKAPAALCRKVAQAKQRGESFIEVWGDGLARRSYMHVDDCLDALIPLMESDYSEPLNIGSDEAVTVNELVEMIARAAEWPVEIRHVMGPEGVRSRNADISRAREALGWEPRIPLEQGIGELFRWVEKQVAATL